MTRDSRHRASLTLNVLLAGTVALLATWQALRPSAAAPSCPAAPPPARGPIPGGAAFVPGPAAVEAPPAGAADWLAQLRAAGIAEPLLARMAAAEFDARWEEQEEDAQRRYDHGELDPDDLQALAQERDAARERSLRAALGDAGFERWDRDQLFHAAHLGRVWLSASEEDALYAGQREARDALRALELAQRGGGLDEAEAFAERGRVQAHLDEETRRLLGEARWATVQGLDDEGAALRREARHLGLADAQVQELLRARARWDAQRAALGQQGAAAGGAGAEAEQALGAARDAEYQRVLGAEGLAALQREEDPRYATMRRYADAWALDEGEVERAWAIMAAQGQAAQKAHREGQQLEREGQPVDWGAVEASIQRSAEQAEQALRRDLGDARFERMRKNQAVWLER